jgi:hypothetical protein
MLARIRRGNFVEDTRETVAIFTKEWLASVAVRVRPSTHASYSRNLRLHVIPVIGSLRLQQLTAADLNSLYGHLLTERRANKNCGLSPRTVRYIHHRPLRA